MSDQLDWQKWSAFSTHNPYVAEAERFSKPGSVAQKKAFFEAHYKKLAAARKAAAEEALLLQQQTPSKPQPENLPPPLQQDTNGGGNKDWLVSEPDLEISRRSLDAEKENCGIAESEINSKVSTGEEQVEEEKPILKVYT